MTDKPTLDTFGYTLEIPTRWIDNDVYGHVNNIVYYSWFDTVVNRFLMERAGLDYEVSKVIGLVVETRCTYHAAVKFPEVITAGLKVSKIGNSSVTYAIGLFKAGLPQPVAEGHFVHVYVDRDSRKPVPIPNTYRSAMMLIS